MGMVQCGSLSLVVQCNYSILRAILVGMGAVVLFEWHGEHTYIVINFFFILNIPTEFPIIHMLFNI